MVEFGCHTIHGKIGARFPNSSPVGDRAVASKKCPAQRGTRERVIQLRTPHVSGPGFRKGGRGFLPGNCYATAMLDYDRPQIAIDEIIRLSKQVGTPIEDRPEFQIL